MGPVIALPQGLTGMRPGSMNKFFETSIMTTSNCCDMSFFSYKLTIIISLVVPYIFSLKHVSTEDVVCSKY